MLEFKVCLTKRDIKKFIIYVMGVRKFRSISILVLTFFLIIFLALRGFISKPSCFTFLQPFCFLIPLVIGLYRGYSVFKYGVMKEC